LIYRPVCAFKVARSFSLAPQPPRLIQAGSLLAMDIGQPAGILQVGEPKQAHLLMSAGVVDKSNKFLFGSYHRERCQFHIQEMVPLGTFSNELPPRRFAPPRCCHTKISVAVATECLTTKLTGGDAILSAC
jgi:hypothetical protein